MSDPYGGNKPRTASERIRAARQRRERAERSEKLAREAGAFTSPILERAGNYVHPLQHGKG